jgi:hypothetical protein
MVWARSGRLKRADNLKRGRGRPNLTWEEFVNRYLKDWIITKELGMDSDAWKFAIHVPQPWVGFKIFWVSPLAYPNLFGTKGFVVIVVGCYYSSCCHLVVNFFNTPLIDIVKFIPQLWDLNIFWLLNTLCNQLSTYQFIEILAYMHYCKLL